MLTPEFLRRITERTEQAVSQFNEGMVQRVVRRMLSLFDKEGKISIIPSSIHDIQKIKESGKLYDEIAEEVSKRIPEIQEEVKLAFRDVEQKINADNIKTTVEIMGEDAAEAEIEQSGKLTPKEKRLMERAYNATNGEIYNMTRTTAEMWQKTYIDACDEAYWKATHGVSVNQAVKEAIDRVAMQGSKIKYPSGHEDTIEVAIARAVRTGVNQAAGDVTLTRCAETGAGHVIVSSHIGARVTDKDEPANHASWQGKVYSLDWSKPELAKYKPTLQEEKENEVRGFLIFQKLKNKFQVFRKRKKEYPDFINTTGYGTGAGLCGWNCRHNFFMFDPDINTNNQMQYNSKENEEYYNLTQEQRKLERAIRKTKRRLNAAEYAIKTTGDPVLQKEEQLQAQHLEVLLQKQQKAYTDFCKDHKLKHLEDRLYVAKKYGVPNRYGEYSKNLIENKNEPAIIKSGAISGARNPLGKAAQKHAEKYYGLVRSMKTDVAKISKVTGISISDVQTIKNHLFIDEHDLGESGIKRFDPDYAIAESWQRLIDGKPEKHDMTLLNHELTERKLMDQGLKQDEAHLLASQEYNYSKEVIEFYGKIKKYRKE